MGDAGGNAYRELGEHNPRRKVPINIYGGGSFSFRAKRDGRDWEGAASLRRLQDGEHSGCTTEMEQSAAVGGNVLAVAGAEAEKGAELVIASTEPRRGPERLEAPHTSDPAFYAPVILLDSLIANDKTGPVRCSGRSASRSGSLGKPPAS